MEMYVSGLLRKKFDFSEANVYHFKNDDSHIISYKTSICFTESKDWKDPETEKAMLASVIWGCKLNVTLHTSIPNASPNCVDVHRVNFG